MALLMPQGKHQYFTTAGEPLNGGKVYTYAAGTTTPLTTYSAQSGAPGTENANPVVLDARGEATIFFGAAGYKVVLKDASDATIWTQDNLFPALVTETFTITDDLTFTGTGNRILGDFSDFTVGANRVFFRSSTTNGPTLVSAMPNGTGNLAGFAGYAGSDPDNTSVGSIVVRLDTSETRITSGVTGTGTYLPITFYTNGAEKLRIDTSGNVLMKSAALLGYGTGAGGTVTQATSKITDVTLDKPTGIITTHNASLASGVEVTFLVNNSLCTSLSNVLVQPSGAIAFNLNYQARAYPIDGGFYVTLSQNSGGARSDAVSLLFKVFAGASS
jgi:hypothetical protein